VTTATKELNSSLCSDSNNSHNSLKKSIIRELKNGDFLLTTLRPGINLKKQFIIPSNKLERLVLRQT
jgi:hypothetical protein